MIGIVGIIVVFIYDAAKFNGNGAAIAIVMILFFAIILGCSILQVIESFLLKYPNLFFHHRSSSFDTLLH